MAELKNFWGFPNSTLYKKMQVFFMAPLGGLAVASSVYNLAMDCEDKQWQYVGLAAGGYLLVRGLTAIPELRRRYKQEKSESDLEKKLGEQ